MKKALIVFGTRPEVIKMAPLIRACAASKVLEPVACSTAQHRDLLDNELSFLEVKPDFDLDLMRPNQDLFDVTSGALLGMKRILNEVKPAVVLVQGDTTTAFTAGLAAFYLKIPVAHVEAGLRTGNLYSPFPEEGNRKLIGTFAAFHFAPTQRSVDNLLKENVDEKTVFLTGNTGIDSLIWAGAKNVRFDSLEKLYRGKKLVLLTSHRRESFGEPMERSFKALRAFAEKHADYHLVYPVHPNPNVKATAAAIFSKTTNISLVPPLGYGELVQSLRDCHFVVTDSGGLQEEAPTFGKPVVVLRENTERPEAVTAGCARLVGTDPKLITETLEALAQPNSSLYATMAKAQNPFGDGKSAGRILKILEDRLA